MMGVGGGKLSSVMTREVAGRKQSREQPGDTAAFQVRRGCGEEVVNWSKIQSHARDVGQGGKAAWAQAEEP